MFETRVRAQAQPRKKSKVANQLSASCFFFFNISNSELYQRIDTRTPLAFLALMVSFVSSNCWIEWTEQHTRYLYQAGCLKRRLLNLVITVHCMAELSREKVQFLVPFLIHCIEWCLMDTILIKAWNGAKEH